MHTPGVGYSGSLSETHLHLAEGYGGSGHVEHKVVPVLSRSCECDGIGTKCRFASPGGHLKW